MCGVTTSVERGQMRDSFAAVGLAELGDQSAIEWLLDKAKPNDFGLDESINLSRHESDSSGSAA